MIHESNKEGVWSWYGFKAQRFAFTLLGVKERIRQGTTRLHSTARKEWGPREDDITGMCARDEDEDVRPLTGWKTRIMQTVKTRLDEGEGGGTNSDWKKYPFVTIIHTLVSEVAKGYLESPIKQLSYRGLASSYRSYNQRNVTFNLLSIRSASVMRVDLLRSGTLV